ncbi:hypothetical protein [Euzebya tangerina]|uniref:hypothetical protein n=1 Tax=Euzebya tangerina TaxID=591198 RepID=UPI000E31D0A0|nr:hypothetical protein [Euzebya tangerina]
MRPEWAAAVFRQQQSQLRNYLTSTRVDPADRPADGGIAVLDSLVEDSMPLLPATSPLYGVTHLLGNYLTRREGFDRLYRLHFHGSEHERVVATLGLNLLRDLERSHRFFEGMQDTYDAVVQSRHLPPRELRKLSSQYFRRAVDHVPYAIKGWEHLP